MAGTLYLVPVKLSETSNTNKSFPHYNLDIILKTNCFIVENAKTARSFLSQCGKQNVQEINIYEIDKHNLSFEQIELFLHPIFENIDIAILSESGCPCVADPGNLFVRYAHEKNIKIIPMIGPSSIILALMSSGLNGQNFCFHGYLPIDNIEKEMKLKQIEKDISNYNRTAIFIETPYRNNNLFQYLLSKINKNLFLCIATDISGDKEFIKTKKISDWRKEKIEIIKLPTIFLLGN